MHRANIWSIWILKTPIRSAPSPLMEIIQYHLGEDFNSSNRKSFSPTTCYYS